MDKQIGFFRKHKIVMITILLMVILTVLFLAFNQWMQRNSQQTDTSLVGYEEVQSISLPEAREIATDYLAGQVTDIDTVQEDGYELYEVKIRTAQGVFAVYIDKQDGAIVKQTSIEDTDDPSNKLDTNQTQTNEGQPNVDTQPPNTLIKPKTNLTLSEAKTVALKEINGVIVESEREYDDGILYYEFKISTGKKLYEVEIHAQSGLVTKVKLEDDDDDD